MSDTRTRTWVWRFDRPAKDIWPILGDTARFNEAAGLPKHVITESVQPDGSVRFFARARLGPISLSWEEVPVNWVHEQWFEHCRNFKNGPLAFLCARLALIPEGTGCRCEYTVTVAARNMLGRLMLASGFFQQINRSFAPLAASAREYARSERDTPFDCKPPALGAGAKSRARVITQKIEATPNGHGLAVRLAEFVLSRQEVDVWAMRPLELARLWGVPERHAIELCLEAVKQGLLRLRWDLLCPRCQVGKGSVVALDELPRGTHCGSCNIEYERDYSNNVELVFLPASAIRPIEGGEYCLFGPMSTPHIKLHLTLAPGECRSVPVCLEHGHYRLRTLEPGGEAELEWTQGGFPKVVASGDDVYAGEPSALGHVVLENNAQRKLTLIVEELEWRRGALTAKRVTALQVFRDLFSEQALRPGDDVEIDHITIMFSDLKGSTALYERIGDAQAYHLVREHFALLGHAIREHNGALVKTIGDAVMGAFTDPYDALSCAISIQDDFWAFNQERDTQPVVVKLGLHSGRCISVTLNNRLDYYGTAANKAARLEAQSRGGDIVLSYELAADPRVAELLVELDVEEDQARLKGYEEPICFLRVSADALSRKRGQTT